MSKITVSAKGESCQVMFEHICNGDPETTVFSHKNGSYNFGGKSSDLLGAYACSSCHDVIDGRNNTHGMSRAHVLLTFYEGIFRTMLILVEKGLVMFREDNVTCKKIQRNNTLIMNEWLCKGCAEMVYTEDGDKPKFCSECGAKFK